MVLFRLMRTSCHIYINLATDNRHLYTDKGPTICIICMAVCSPKGLYFCWFSRKKRTAITQTLWLCFDYYWTSYSSKSSNSTWHFTSGTLKNWNLSQGKSLELTFDQVVYDGTLVPIHRFDSFPPKRERKKMLTTMWSVKERSFWCKLDHTGSLFFHGQKETITPRKNGNIFPSFVW